MSQPRISSEEWIERHKEYNRKVLQDGMDSATHLLNLWMDYFRKSDRSVADYAVFIHELRRQNSPSEIDMMLMVAILQLLDAETAT